MKAFILSIIVFPIFILSNCTNGFNPRFDPTSGCLLQEIQLKDERFEGQTGYVGWCVDDRWVGRWEVETPEGPVWYQVVRSPEGKVLLQIRLSDNTWVNWSEKGGLEVEPPADFEQ